MFTQAMPAYANAMRSGALFPAMQALGNCQQPLSHRGGVNFSPGPGQNVRGVYNSSPWNPSQYPGLFPGGPSFADFAGMNATWNAGNRYDSQFFFPTDQFFAQNQFFGGPQVHITGGQQIDILNVQQFEGDNVQTTNLTTQNFGGDPVEGPAGPAGGAGRDGRSGAAGRAGVPGAPGRDAAIPQGGFAPLRYLNGINPRVEFQKALVAKPHRYVKDAWLAPFVAVGVPTNSISGGTVSVGTVAVVVPTGVSFDPNTCTVTFSGTTTIHALAGSSPTLTVSGTAAATASVMAATTAFTILASEDVLELGGVLVKKTDADFWETTATVEVARDPELKGVAAEQRRVFQQQDFFGG
jgi:hypothetical protein